MKIKYTYRSNFLKSAMFLGTIGMIFFHINCLNIKNPVSEAVIYIMYFLPLVIFAFFIILLSYMPVTMVADENALNVKVLFRKTAIRYSDIESISLVREFRKPELRGEQNHYNEILTITDINKKKYVYYKKIDLDQDEIAMNPADLTVQFENSTFSQLKRYIEERIPIMQAEI
ncbi:hypothetical protein SAMN02910406_01932 [Ruminococcus albus]|uniref:PH domain-containing protein n=2 Tax=Ruminococcus albus TaxID=1264 RepID=A0A1I1KEI0_RUMAL|nr:hypothetical protein SAMN02910406_01932 [Ruminococcus albus]